MNGEALVNTDEIQLNNEQFRISNLLNLFISLFDIQRSLFIICFLPYCASCNFSGDRDAHATVIKGNIHLPAGSKVYLYAYKNDAEKFLNTKSAADSATVDNNGAYYLSPRWTNSSVFDLRTKNGFLTPELFLCPGDKITLNFTGDNNQPQVELNNNESRYNDYILKMIYKFYDDSDAAMLFYISANYMTGHEFTIYCKKRKEEMLSFYNDYFKNEPVCKIFSDYALAEIKYQDAVYRVKYPIKRRLKGLPIEVDSDYYNFKSPSYLNEDTTAFNSPSYLFFLNLYIKNMYEGKLKNGNYGKIVPGIFNPQVEKFKLADSCLSGLPRKEVEFNIAYNQITATIGSATHYNRDIAHTFSTKSVDSLIDWFQHQYPIK